MQWLNILPHLDARYGGITAAVPSLGQSVMATGAHGVTLAAFCAAEENAPSSLAVNRFPFGIKRWLMDRELWRRMRRLISGSDGVHIHGIWQEHCAVGSLLARGAAKPYVISAHGMLERWALEQSSWKKAIYRRLIEDRNLRQARCLHALTPDEAGDYRRAGFRNPIAIAPNGVHIPTGINAEPFLKTFPELRGRKLVLFLGRLHPKKGLDILSDAWRSIASREGDAHLVIAGPGDDQMNERLRQLPHVTLTGMLGPDLKWSALAASSLFVLPSYSEGFSVSVLEAAGMGVPVVVTEACHAPFVSANGCGWEIPATAPALTSALSEFFRTPETELAAMGARGRALVATQFSWPVVGRQMASIYDFVLGGAVPSNLEFLPAQS